MAYIGPVSDYMYIEMSLELVDSPRFSISNLVGWLVGFWCTHFRDLAPLINLFS